MLRLAALLHDIGKPATRRKEPDGRVSFHHHEVVGAKLTRRRLRELRYPKAVVDEVAQLVFLHLRFHGYGTGEWTDSAVRRYVTDAGPLLDRLHALVRSDCTTRNRRRAAALQRSYDSLEQRIAALRAQEELDAIRPDLDGNAIMQLLGIPPGPLVGQGVPAPARAADGARAAGSGGGGGGAAAVGGGERGRRGRVVRSGPETAACRVGQIYPTPRSLTVGRRGAARGRGPAGRAGTPPPSPPPATGRPPSAGPSSAATAIAST